MAGLYRQLRVAAVALPFLFLAMSGMAHANFPINYIVVNTLFGQSVPVVPGPCSLADALSAANEGTTVQNCVGESGAINIIEFAVTGTISVAADQAYLISTSFPVWIVGPPIGGITIDGAASVSVMLLAGPGSNVFLENLTFFNGGSTLGVTGGAILSEGTTMTIENSTFNSNIANLGGAIYALSGTDTITNCTFYSNSASESGGAIYNDGATLLLTNDTFDDNFADDDGGSLYSANPVTKYKATLFAGGTPNNCAASAGADHKDIGYNISTDNSCAFSMASSKVENPGLDAAGLASNGGPTQTISLVAGANAIGFDTDCTDQESTPEPVSTDQRLYGRPNSPSFCDSGAYEHDAVPPIEVVGNILLQIARSTSPDSDEVNTGFDFIDNGDGKPADCDEGTNAINGLYYALYPGTCADLPDSYLYADMVPFVLHGIGTETYGTFYGTNAPLTVSARVVRLGTPAGSCGEWSLNIEFMGFDSAFLGSGPFAMILEDTDDNVGCFNIPNAVVGTATPPPGRTVRR
jgi:predicted outer membrane repeat protein